MDIGILNQALPGRGASVDIADLLPRLRAAGTIEAEVISRLPDSLLLQTRLGQIQTRNRLHYQPGDRIMLRLAGDADNPVLKTSDATPRPISLDASLGPKLYQALPADRAVFASIARFIAETTVIRLADQLLVLPRRLDLPRGQLLSLTRRSLPATIEIEPIDRKRLFVAMLRHLLPYQAAPGPTDLVRLFRLALDVDAATQSRLASGARRTARDPSPAPPTGSKTGPERDSSARPGATAVTVGGAPKATAPTARIAAAAPTALPQPPAPVTGRRQDAACPPAANTTGSATAKPDQATNPMALRGETRDASGVLATPARAPAQTRPGTATAGVSRGLPPATWSPRAPAGTQPVAPASTEAIARAGPELPSRPGKTAAANPSATATAPPRPASSPLPAPVAGAAAVTPLLELLAAIPTLRQLDAPGLRRWFEDLGFVRPPAGKATARPAGGNLLRLLQSLADGEALTRDLLQHVAPRGRARSDADTRTTAAGARETQLPWVRDAIRLVEQALSQNLVQRASLGLQQETQQPTTLSFALPLLDQQQVRPLQIELAQKRRTQDETGNAWEIRIGFEFANLGPLSCHIVLEGVAVAASFYCASSQTRDRLEQALPELRRQLDAAGFIAGELHGFIAAADAPAATPDYRFSEALIDIEV